MAGIVMPENIPEAPETQATQAEELVHAHRTAKVVELVGASTKGFEDAIEHALEDASASTRGITGAKVENMSVRCKDGEITEYKVDLKVAFGIEGTKAP